MADPMVDTRDLVAAYNATVQAHIDADLQAWEAEQAEADQQAEAARLKRVAETARAQIREAASGTAVLAGHIRSDAVMAWAYGVDHQTGGPGDADLIALADDLEQWASVNGGNPLNGIAMAGALTFEPDQEAARQAVHDVTNPTLQGRHRVRAAEAARGIKAVVIDGAAGRVAVRWEEAGDINRMKAELPATLGRPATPDDMIIYRARLSARAGVRLPFGQLIDGIF